MATLDEVQPHEISLESSVVLESLRARMISQYLYGTETPDSANIVHEVQIPHRRGEMQCVRAIADCGGTSIFMTPRVLQ